MARRALSVLSVALCAWAADGAPGAAVEIRYLRAGAEAVNPGGSTTLYWDTRYAASCELAPGPSPVDLPSGEEAVFPDRATTYTLTCQGPGGPAVAHVEVRVQPPPRVLSVSATPDTIAQGGSARIAWSAQDASACFFRPGDERVPLSGSREVSPPSTTTYAVSCEGVGPSSFRTASVGVGAVAINSFRAEPAGPLGPLETATLSWESEWASACAITPDVGPVGVPQGQQTLTPGRPTSYTLTCQGFGGPREATVGVAVRPVRIDSFSAAPNPTPRPGAKSTLSWTSSDAVACSLDQGIGPVERSGSREVGPSDTTRYALTCTGETGPRRATLDLRVDGVAAVLSFSADPDYFRYDWTIPVRFKWTTRFVTKCSLVWVDRRKVFPDLQPQGELPIDQLGLGDNHFELECEGAYGRAQARLVVATYWEDP